MPYAPPRRPVPVLLVCALATDRPSHSHAGFTSIGWSSRSGFHQDHTSFLFTLRNPSGRPQRMQRCVSCHSPPTTRSWRVVCDGANPPPLQPANPTSFQASIVWRRPMRCTTTPTTGRRSGATATPTTSRSTGAQGLIFVRPLPPRRRATPRLTLSLSFSLALSSAGLAGVVDNCNLSGYSYVNVRTSFTPVGHTPFTDHQYFTVLEIEVFKLRSPQY